MSNKTCVTVNSLLWLLMEAHQRRVKSDLIKDVHPVSDSNLNIEKVCVNYTNGDTIEFIVDDEDNSMSATLTMKEEETNPAKPIKGRLTYKINKWPDEVEASQTSAYLAKLMYVINDVQDWYETVRSLYD